MGNQRASKKFCFTLHQPQLLKERNRLLDILSGGILTEFGPIGDYLWRLRFSPPPGKQSGPSAEHPTAV
jgi:hypothetical protein